MLLTLHRHACTLWHGDYPVRWVEWAFAPAAGQVLEHPSSGNRTVREASTPHVVRTPPLSRLAGAAGLVTPENPKLGFDAATVARLAEKGERGFAFVEAAEIVEGPGDGLQGEDSGAGPGCDSPGALASAIAADRPDLRPGDGYLF